MTSARTIAIDLFDGAEELDVVGPWEVFSFWTQTYPQDGWHTHLVSDDGQPRRAAKGLGLVPTASWESLTPALIVEPGGRGSRVRMHDEGHRRRLQNSAAGGALMTSVCTGALVLAAAGLLDGHDVTTHHENYAELLAARPNLTIRRGSRFVDSGKVVTSAGVSAGIDMALHIVGRLSSPRRAREVQSGIEYFPAPPAWGNA